jgi:hypothetical protein
VFGCGVIDLAMMRPGLPLLRQAMTKAESAYGLAMAMTLPKAQLCSYIRSLRRVLG